MPPLRQLVPPRQPHSRSRYQAGASVPCRTLLQQWKRLQSSDHSTIITLPPSLRSNRGIFWTVPILPGSKGCSVTAELEDGPENGCNSWNGLIIMGELTHKTSTAFCVFRRAHLFYGCYLTLCWRNLTRGYVQIPPKECDFTGTTKYRLL